MRTLNERQDDRKELMQGVSDADVTVTEAILELCRTIDDASERIVEGFSKAIARAADEINVP
jgi:hypothetical protein